MQPYQHEYLVTDAHVDCFGRLKRSMLLFFCQDVAGHHCLQLGTDYDTLAAKNLFWAVIRQKVQITRLPMTGERIRVETWPMPTTRTCYPRSTVAYDACGNELFRAIGLWVLMDRDSRSMILPGKSGVDVAGLLTGTELSAPLSLIPRQLPNLYSRTVSYSDLDRNAHMNNTRYLEWMDDLLPACFHQTHTPKEFTICYHAEAREGTALQLHWLLGEDGMLHVEGTEETPGQEASRRIFAAQVRY